jgi:predicted O-linked N-acetylglucosamine transferase (SPINDLY family)
MNPARPAPAPTVPLARGHASVYSRSSEHARNLSPDPSMKKNPPASTPQAPLADLNRLLAANDLAKAGQLAGQLAGQGALPIVELFTTAQRISESGRPQEAIALYRRWLAGTASPLAYAVMFNLGVLVANEKDDAGAEELYRRAIAVKPDFLEAHLNLATLRERRGDPQEALTLWNHVTAIASPNNEAQRNHYIQAINNLGRLLEIRKQFPDAEDMLTRSLLIDPDQPKVLTHLIHLRQKQCKWPIYSPIQGVSMKSMIENTSALAMLSASGDPAVQLSAARRYVDEKILKPTAPLAPAAGYNHPRLRVGYLSSDLHSHAVGILTTELYELHDRNRVEVFAFCWTHEDGSPLRARIVSAVDHLVRIVDMTDEQAAQAIRAHEIDILIDLHGLTAGTRPDILSYRPAPIQMTYLGFPGTTALPCIDYVISDKFVLPPELAEHFTEKPLYMPECFQINDRRRQIGVTPTRASCGLPEDAFIFCSFNNNYKFTEEVFTSWMRILKRVPGSILWTVSDHQSVRENLKAFAISQDVDPARLYFADRALPADYLARYQIADLFLDTFPFNAGTTASDALWAGLPLLTYSGKTFSSRMAGSLLHAVNLPELVTHTLTDYEDKAVSLANDRPRIEQMKNQLVQHRFSCTLFDSPRFVRDLETLYERIAVHPIEDMKQTAINDIANVDVLRLMAPQQTHIVEVGSSSGALAKAYLANSPGTRYTGIEIVEEYAEASKANCSDVIFGNVEHIADDKFADLGTAQTWVFADALEHLYDPWKLLKRIRANAKGPVEIIACIPNAQNWGIQSILNNGTFLYQDSGLLDRTHIRWFTRISILHMFQSCGFQVVEMNVRKFRDPSDQIKDALRAMANAVGADPEMAVQDAIPFQYVLRAVSLA